METLFIILKIFLYSIVGYYIIALLEKNKNFFASFYSPFYALFSLIAITNTSNSVIWIGLSGIIWAWTLKLFLNAIDRKFVPTINWMWFGFLNLTNVFFLNGLIDKFIYSSSSNSISILLTLGLLTTLIDLSTNMRNSL